MLGFKLLAIRPLEGCDRMYLRVLQPNVIYKFYNNYSFLDAEGQEISSFGENQGWEVFSIQEHGKTPDLFSLVGGSGKRHHVNVSALVGKNGSGKSAITELLYLTVYVLGLRLKFLPGISDYEDEIQRLRKHKGNYEKVVESRLDEISQIKLIHENLKLELFYEVGENLFCLRIDKGRTRPLRLLAGDQITKRKFKITELLEEDEERDNDLLENLFYSIALNYSMYGLNSKVLGTWIDTLFHKNDGYKTPLVINPFRNEGNYDINNETHLAQSRILANLIDGSLSVKELVDGKHVESITFEIDESKLKTFRSISFDNILDIFLADHNTSLEEAFIRIYMQVLDSDEPEAGKASFEKQEHTDLIARYVIKKLFKIAGTYDEYRIYLSIPEKDPPIPELHHLDDFLTKLSIDKSHKTLKLRQILNAVRFNILREDQKQGIVWKEGRRLTLPVSVFIERIKETQAGSAGEIVEYVPVAFFNPKVNIRNESVLQVMSSGEQQMINVLQTVYYHLINLNSVFNNEDTAQQRVKYRHVNIVLDEIELYFHPEFQRRFIHELLAGLKRLDLQHIDHMNFLFCTHSPFILSDIPASNILRLDNGLPVEGAGNEQTFGANIHDLLANEFFLKGSFMGEFAKNKINSLITFLVSGAQSSDEWDASTAKEFIELIGEPLLRSELRELYLNVFYDPAMIDGEIKRLEDLKRQKGGRR